VSPRVPIVGHEYRREEGEMTDGSIPAAAMGELVAAGQAKPLLTGFDVSPTSYDGRWWYVPSGSDDDADYLLADADLSANFDRLRERADRLDAFLASGREEDQ
jgi:hypothetical protein